MKEETLSYSNYLMYEHDGLYRGLLEEYVKNKSKMASKTYKQEKPTSKNNSNINKSLLMCG